MQALLAAAHGDASIWNLAVSATHATGDFKRDALAASHDTANTLPAYNVRRFSHEHPPCLEQTRLPWATRPPKREAPLRQVWNLAESATTTHQSTVQIGHPDGKIRSHRLEPTKSQRQ